MLTSGVTLQELHNVFVSWGLGLGDNLSFFNSFEIICLSVSGL